MPVIKVDNNDQDGWEKMLDELLERESGLTTWEIDFLDSLDKLRGRSLSEKQLAVLDKIHNRLCY